MLFDMRFKPVKCLISCIKHYLAFILICHSTFAQVAALSTKNSLIPTSFADIVEPLLPSVVNISTTSEITNERRQLVVPGNIIEEMLQRFGIEEGMGRIPSYSRKSSSLGSGFIIAQKGNDAFIVTCNHVIEDAHEINVILHNDNIEYKAEIVGCDRRTDLALLKIKTDKQLTIAMWGESSKVRVGDWNIAIGNPYGLSSTVTAGIISTLARDIGGSSHNVSTDYIDGYIQTDASLNSGNSGGPIFSVDGKVIAISTAIFSPNGGNVGINFGIPSDTAKTVIQQLMDTGRTKRGWIGVKVQPVSDEDAEVLNLKKAAGALVIDVTPQSPAHKVGIRRGDILLKFNHKEIKKSRHLPRIIGETPIGQSVPVTLWRDHKEHTFMINTTEYDAAETTDTRRVNVHEDKVPISKKKELGLIVHNITQNMRENVNIVDGVKGIVTAYVDPQSEAAEKGMRPGDIIIEILTRDKKIQLNDVNEFYETIKMARKNKNSHILLLVARRTNLQFISLNVNESKFMQSED